MVDRSDPRGRRYGAVTVRTIQERMVPAEIFADVSIPRKIRRKGLNEHDWFSRAYHSAGNGKKKSESSESIEYRLWPW